MDTVKLLACTWVGAQPLGSNALGDDTGGDTELWWCHVDLKEMKEYLQQNGENGENLVPTCVCQLDFCSKQHFPTFFFFIK